MLRCSAVVAALLLFASAAHAQRALSGTVMDAATGETLPGANVAVLGPDGAVVGGTATGLDGRFTVRLTRLPVDVAVRYLGYETMRLHVTAETPGEVTVALLASEAALGEATVVADVGRAARAHALAPRGRRVGERALRRPPPRPHAAARPPRDRVRRGRRARLLSGSVFIARQPARGASRIP